MKHTEFIELARKRAVPILAIKTFDPVALYRTLCSDVIPEVTNGSEAETPIAKLTWDLHNDFIGFNKAGEKVAKAGNQTLTDMVAKGQPHAAVRVITDSNICPRNSIVFMLHADRYIDNVHFLTAVHLLRNDFEGLRRMLILLGHDFRLPPELQQDIIVVDDELPNEQELDAELRKLCGEAHKLPDDKLAMSARACKGQTLFATRQNFSLSLTKDGVDLDQLWSRKKRQVEQTVGLLIESGGETFEQMMGYEAAKTFAYRLDDGPRKPAVYVRVEELEKAMRSGRGDSSGTSDDALQVLLTGMEDHKWSGMLAMGPPGAGKSLFSKAMANTFNALPIRFDINACKGSLVGQSEAQIRNALKVIHAIGGRNVFFIATVNDVSTIDTALRRRFKAGCWFFDAPDTKERAAIWDLNCEQYEIADNWSEFDEPDLMGADINNLCEMAFTIGGTLAEAQNYVIPVKSQSPTVINDCRKQAQGRFVSASYGGRYGERSAAVSSGREITI